MQSPRNQHTIDRSVAVEGFGYWSGLDVHVEFRPAEANTGVVFVRRDLDPPVHIPAVVQHRVEAPRRTTLAQGEVRVEMIEHVMAALAGMQIDNCEVWIDQAEMPGGDGSALPFIAALDHADIVELSRPRERLVVHEVTRVGDHDDWIEAKPAADGALTLEYYLDYGSAGGIGKQAIQLTLSPDTFRNELAPSRTFMLKQEADWLLARGLGTRVSLNDLLVFGSHGPLQNELRFPDECVRHKTLDLVGDLALIGCDVTAHLVAHRSGHRLNATLVRALIAQGKAHNQVRRSA